MKHLYFGPWAGELGWELCFVIPVIRRIAKLGTADGEPFDRVTVAGPAGHSWLWEFATTYVNLRTNGGTSFQHGDLLEPAPPPPAGPDVVAISPDALFRKHGKREKAFLRGKPLEPAARIWREHLPRSTKIADVLVSFRPPKAGAAFKAWPEDRAAELTGRLIGRGMTVAAIGGPDNFRPPGAIDARGIHWRALAGGIRGALAVVGPSSGPLHFAALCRATRIVTWFAGHDDTIEARYLDRWNPFRRPVEWIGTFGKQPETEAVLQGVLR